MAKKTKAKSRGKSTAKKNYGSNRNRSRKKPSAANALNFVSESHAEIREQLNAATELPEFRETTGYLTLEDRQNIVAQARVLIEQNFVHLPLKEAMHGINPRQKLLLLQHKLAQIDEDSMDDELVFHREMLEIFTSFRDLHTTYMLPDPFRKKIAFMPFNVEEYHEGENKHYIATHIVQGFTHSHFKSGVEISSWNGVPITRAIEVAASQHAGSNLAARHARGIDGLTIRALTSTLPPDEDWVIVGYTDLKGRPREMRQEWIVAPTYPKPTVKKNTLLTGAATVLGLDIEADIRQQARKMLFAPHVIAAERKKGGRLTKTAAKPGAKITTAMAGVFKAGSVETSFGIYGYIRIFTFYVEHAEDFIEEFIRLLSLLPRTGLILDMRGNGGGNILASEGLLQTLSPYDITPEPTQFINTPLNAAICEKHRGNPDSLDLDPWYESISNAITTGAVYSRAFPITSTEFANAWGQQYHGPVVLITDARCYSATDIFAAGFKDHDIGKIIGVDKNTGAGGANVWQHGLIKYLFDFPGKSEIENPYQTLPEGADMSVAIRRTLRVGKLAGTPVEDIGVTPDIEYYMTREDLLNGNKDLINKAAEILHQQPRRQLDVDVYVSGSTLEIEATTENLDRLDIYVDERPLESTVIGNGKHHLAVTVEKNARFVIVAGHKEGVFVAACHYEL